MTNQYTEKAGKCGNISGSNQNQNTFAGGKGNRFDVSNNTSKEHKNQDICGICNPLAKKSVATICENCANASRQIEARIFENTQHHQKIIRLQRCFGCDKCFAPSKFSTLGICKKCAAIVQTKSKIARSNFVARTVNNFHKALAGGVQSV